MNSISTIEILMFIQLLLLFVLFRNFLIHDIRSNAISITSKLAIKDLHNNVDWKHRYDKLNKYDSYNSMMFQLHKWTFDSFYYGLVGEDELRS